jgi:gas vesicle protein
MAYAGKVGERHPRLSVVAGSTRRVGPVATGVALGLLVGAGVALLLAPRSGADTRRSLRRGLKRAHVRGSDAWEDLRLELRHARRRLKRAGRRTRLAAEDIEPVVED